MTYTELDEDLFMHVMNNSFDTTQHSFSQEGLLALFRHMDDYPSEFGDRAFRHMDVFCEWKEHENKDDARREYNLSLDEALEGVTPVIEFGDGRVLIKCSH